MVMCNYDSYLAMLRNLSCETVILFDSSIYHVRELNALHGALTQPSSSAGVCVSSTGSSPDQEGGRNSSLSAIFV